MPLGGSNISWDNTTPAGSEAIGTGDDRIRSMKTSVQQAFANEHVFAATGGAGTGAHLPGSAVAFYGTQSRVSSSDTDGRLMVASDTSRLFGVGSTGTALLGAGPFALSMGSFPVTFPQRAYIATETGREASDGAGRFVVTFPNSGFSTTPFVLLQSGGSNFVGAGYNANLCFVNTSGFSAVIRDLSNNLTASQSSLFWFAVGTRTL